MDKRINERNPEQFGKLEEQVEEVKIEYKNLKEGYADKKAIMENSNI